MNPIKTERFNTNNGWGFGGAIGVETIYDNGLFCRKGRNYFRHTPSESFERWFIEFEGDKYELNKKPKPGDKIFKTIRGEDGEDGFPSFNIAKDETDAAKIAKRRSPYHEIVSTELYMTV